MNETLLLKFEDWKKGKADLTCHEIIQLCEYFKIEYPESISEVKYSSSPYEIDGKVGIGSSIEDVFKCLHELEERERR